jgi:hypothetical protein
VVSLGSARENGVIVKRTPITQRFAVAKNIFWCGTKLAKVIEESTDGKATGS